MDDDGLLKGKISREPSR